MGRPPPRRPTRARAATRCTAVSAAVLAATASARAAGAPAQPAPVELAWDAPAECPDRARALAALRALVSPPAGPTPRASVRIARDAVAGSYHVTVETGAGDDASERSLEGDTCAQAADAAVLVVAIAVDPTAALRASAPMTPPAEPAPTPAPVVPVPVVPVPVVAPPVRSRGRAVELVLGVGAGLDVGTLGDAVPGLIAYAGVRASAWRMEATFSLWPARQFVGPNGPHYAGSVALTAAGVRACFAPRWRALEGGPCGGLEAGAMRVEAGITGLPRSAAEDPWVGATLGGAIGLRLFPWLALRVEALGGLTVVHSRFEFADRAGNVPLFEPPLFYFRGGLSAEVRF